MEQENIPVLVQYVEALEEAVERLERAYLEKDIGSFNQLKRFILDIKSKIDFVLR